jgi:hypothetical protein
MRIKHKTRALDTLPHTEESPIWPINEFPRPVFVERNMPLALLAWTNKVSDEPELHVFCQEQPISKELYMLAERYEDD